MKFRKNDSVIVTSGGDRGKTGLISKILPKVGKVIVEGVNKKIRHIKGRDGQPGQKAEFFAPIHISNVSIVDPKTKKPSKIGYKVEGKEKIRIARKSGEVIQKTAQAAKKAPQKTTKK